MIVLTFDVAKSKVNTIISILEKRTSLVLGVASNGMLLAESNCSIFDGESFRSSNMMNGVPLIKSILGDGTVHVRQVSRKTKSSTGRCFVKLGNYLFIL